MAITIDGAPFVVGTLPDKTLGDIVQLDTSIAASAHAWEILSKPDGSAAVLSSAVINNPTFTIDVPGSYSLRLIRDGTTPDHAIVTSVGLRLQERSPAYAEGDSSQGGDLAGNKGWASAVEDLYRKVDALTARAKSVVAINNQGADLTRGQVVYFTDMIQVGATAHTEDFVPEVQLASALNYQTLFHVGIVMGGLKGEASIPHQGRLLVCLEGIVSGVDTTAFTSTGSPVFVADVDGDIDTVPGTDERCIGELFLAPALAGSIVLKPPPEGSVSYLTLDTVAPTLTDEQAFLAGGERIRCIILDTDTAGAAIALTLDPPLEKHNGRPLMVKLVGAFTATVVAAAPNSIHLFAGGLTTITFTSPGSSVILYYDHVNSRYHIV